MSILIFLPESDLSPAGGPLGVGYYIHQEVLKRNLSDQISFLSGTGSISYTRTFVKKIIDKLPAPILKHIHSVRRLQNLRRMLSSTSSFTNFQNFDAVHFHSTLDLWLSREALKSYKGEVILTSHSPVPAFEEFDDYCTTSYEKYWFRANIERFIEIDRFAFSHSDYVIFPTEGAMDAYRSHWPEFQNIIESKRVHFIATGISPRIAKLSRSQVFQKLGLKSDSFLISFAGRHNHVKGYDLLRDLAKDLFEVDSQIKVVAAGNESPLKRLDHPSWIEVGFTKDPYSYIAASDILIVPNRETYFDLVVLEGLSLGKIILASNTGGNRYFDQFKAPGVFLFDNIEEAKDLVQRIKEMPKVERDRLGTQNFDFYKNHLTSECFFNLYWSFLSQINAVG